MVGYAINYYRDFVAPTKQFREPTEGERAALGDLRDALNEVLNGGVPMTSGIARRVVEYFREKAKVRDEVVNLNPFVDAVRARK